MNIFKSNILVLFAAINIYLSTSDQDLKENIS